MKRIDPNIDTCSTPLVSGKYSEGCPFGSTRSFLSVSQVIFSLIHAVRLAPIPTDGSFLRRCSCGTLLKGFWKSG